MINAEFYKDEILDLVNNGKEIAFNKYTKKIMPCETFPGGAPCKDCLWDARESKSECCVFGAIRWLLTEYEEYPKLSRFQYELLARLSKEFNWIARSKNDDCKIFTGDAKPFKHGDLSWVNSDGKQYYLCRSLDNFDFIKWEDTEPWNIKELLDNCEVGK